MNDWIWGGANVSSISSMTGSREIWEVNRYFGTRDRGQRRKQLWSEERAGVHEVRDTVWLKLGGYPLRSCFGVDGNTRYEGTHKEKKARTQLWFSADIRVRCEVQQVSWPSPKPGLLDMPRGLIKSSETDNPVD